MLRIEPTILQYGPETSGKRLREQPAEFRVNAMDQHAIDAFLSLPANKRKLVRELIEQLLDPENKR